MTGYEIVTDSIVTDANGFAAKTTPSVDGKVVTGGGFRFVPDEPVNQDKVKPFVRENGPYGGAIGGGERWYTSLRSPVPGTLHVYAIMVDA